MRSSTQDEVSHGVDPVRPLVDYEVDRPEVEARQRVEPTGTNRPRTWLCSRSLSCSGLCSELAPFNHRIPADPRHRFGGHGGGETPGPIPNPEVKPSSADGTARATGWESRSLPERSFDEGRPRRGRPSSRSQAGAR